jgi:glycosyltransferase involved in cell wall biosynthesis
MLASRPIVAPAGQARRRREGVCAESSRPIIDDFAAARGVSLEHATAEWLFWMDADDRFDDANREKLRQLLADLPPDNVGCVIDCRWGAQLSGNGNAAADGIMPHRSAPAPWQKSKKQKKRQYWAPSRPFHCGRIADGAWGALPAHRRVRARQVRARAHRQ